MRILKIIGAVAAINMIARLLGFAREVIIGFQYGTSFQADSIITAFTIPNFIYIVLGGAITTAFISIYSKLGDTRKHAFMQTVFTALCIIVGSVTLLFMIFPHFWIELFFSGMSAEAFELTSDLFTWMAPSTFFLVVAMWLSGVLNVHERFQLTAFSTLLFNGIFVLAGVTLYTTIGAFAYGVGATVGSVAMAAILIVYLWRKNIVPLRFKLEKMEETKRFVKLALPILFGGATLQFYFLIQRIYATTLQEGVIASLNYASKMTQFPQAVLMTAVTTVIYPLLAKTAADKDRAKMESHYQKGVRMLCVLLLPATVFVFFYAKEIIQFIFEYGNFNKDSTNLTYPLLQIFSWSMFGLALNMYITRFFYAMENSYLPVICNIISVFGVNILVIHLFIDEWGASAIALGTVISTLFNMICLVVLARLLYKFRLFANANRLKMVLYVITAGLAIALGSYIPIPITFLYLCVGGAITAISILAGFRIFK